VEKLFECESDDIMYVGDHIFTGTYPYICNTYTLFIIYIYMQYIYIYSTYIYI
jgi:hypothetical protein